MGGTVRHVVLGTAGHIDHGKTALVKALTGVDTDRLEEEKRRGITIELGFAPWKLHDHLEASIVDVPGHERLVRTMVAGAGGMDVAMLVVAADDGVMPQTREHLDVLRLLAVPAGLVVLTKCDLVDAELLELAEEDVRETCIGTIFEGSPIIRTSSKTGAGLDELRCRVTEMATAAAGRPSDGPVFLPLDRLFTKAGYGTIGTGTTLRGTLKVGDAVEALGDGPEPIGGLKVRGLQALGTARDEVTSGMRTAVNLTGRDVESVKRGMVLCHADSFVAVDAVVAWLEVLPHARPMEEETLTTHLGTSERETRVIPLGSDTIEPGAAGGALLRFAQPMAAYSGQRLVLRRPGLHGQATVAGGCVLDPEPPRGKGAVSLAASQLERLRGAVDDRLLALARESRAAGLAAAAIVRRLPPGRGEAAANELEKRGKLVRLSSSETRWIDASLADALVKKVVALVAAHHDREPLSPGLVEAEIQSQLPPPERHLAELAVTRAVEAKKVLRDSALLAIPGRGATIDAQAQQQMDAICAVYKESALAPPNNIDVGKKLGLDPKHMQKLLGLLRRQNTLRRISDTFHYDAGALAAIEALVVERLESQAEMTASELKELAGGISRKWAIPLLEYLDRSKITQRVGDVRRLHPSRRKGSDP